MKDNEIYISDSRLKIKLISSEKDIDIKKLKYRVVYTELYTGGLGSMPVSCYTKVPTIKYSWVIEKSSEKYSDIEYTDFELDILIQTMHLLGSDHLDMTENILHAIKDKSLLDEFYLSYGKKLNENFISPLLTLSSKSIKREKSVEYPKMYQRDRYSVYQLLCDLVRDGSYINIGSEVSQKYEKISRSTDDGSTFVGDQWNKIISQQGNRARANLNLRYSTKVSVEVPENEYGVEPGARELKTVRSMCIVKDGMLWYPRLMVKVNDKKLLKKFYGAGIVVCNLTFDDEYILDLTKIPVIGKSKLKNIKSSNFAKEVAEEQFDKLRIAYLNRLIYMKRKGLSKLDNPKPKLEDDTESEAEKYLHRLGIYGDSWFPPRITTEAVTGMYDTFELGIQVRGIVKSYYTDMRKFINFGTCRNKQLEYALKSVDITKDTLENLVKYYTKSYLKRGDRIRDYIFRLIMTKNLKFDEHLKPVATGVSAHYKPGDGVSVSVNWKTENNVVEV